MHGVVLQNNHGGPGTTLVILARFERKFSEKWFFALFRAN
ncbi:hypothetical protein T11_15597 [Trichinella zimbabwensis]|uniref:Uncharacterized protein n=1 Tax=Trichinella zimbabwensis TaxID=268475 RepID=A0A0V1GGY6_9BILA|nr:hypothetical protein T11_15597 [Trichinella zimbabwensis]